jgi:hypothetical protein
VSFATTMTLAESASLLNLPPELIQQILSAISAPADLLSLALATKFFKPLIIPFHIEYRIVKAETSLVSPLWIHLANSPHLTCNIRVLLLGKVPRRHGSWPSAASNAPSIGPLSRQSDILAAFAKALSYMKNLEELVWQVDSPSAVRLNIVPQEVHWRTLLGFQCLTRLALSGNIRQFGDTDSATCSVRLWCCCTKVLVTASRSCGSYLI